MAECLKITAGLTPACDTLREQGGIESRFWIGSIHDITSITYGTGNEFTALALATGKQLFPFRGRKARHNAGHDLEVGENVNLRNQILEAVLYAKTPAEKQAYDQLSDSEDLFVIYITNSGQFEALGIPNAGEPITEYGLKPSAGSGRKGQGRNDPNNKPITLSGQLPNIELVFAASDDYDTNLAAIEALAEPQV